MHDIRALDSDSLFAASDWMRRLARHLVHDDDRADDLVQEAWAAALRNPPRAALRPWLSGILRRKAKEARRLQANRKAREERAAVTERQPSTAELSACAEEQRFLIDCVLALPQKYREVLLLRFYEDLPPRLVAKRLQIPVNTVRTQTQRGLERLRESLDQRHSGDRRAWGLALLPLAVASPASAGAPSSKGLEPEAATLARSTSALWTGAVMVTVLTVGFLVSRGLSADRHLQASGTGVPREGRSTTQSSSELAIVERARRAAISEPSEDESAVFARTIHGEVLDAISRQPIAAFLDGPNGSRIVSSDYTGQFVFGLSIASPCEIQVSHPSYESQTLALSAEDLGEINLGTLKLTPKLLTAITAQDAYGRPLPDIELSLLPCVDEELENREGNLEEPQLPVAMGSTGIDGILELPITEPHVVIGKDATGRISATKVTPSSANLLRFDGPKRRLHVVDDTDRAVAGRNFAVGWTVSAARAAFYVTTDGDGFVVLPSGAGRLEMAMSAPRTLLRSLKSVERSLVQEDHGLLSIQTDLLTAESELTLQVEIREHELTLLNDETGEPVSGKLWYQLQRYRDHDSEWSGIPATHSTAVVDGKARIDGWFADPGEGESADWTRRWIAVQGYEILLVPSTQDLRSATLRLKPAKNRELFVTDRGGRPLHSLVLLRFGKNAAVRVDSDETGYVGRFPWAPGEEWRMNCITLDQGMTEWVVGEEELAENHVVRVKLPVSTGSLQVCDVPRAGPPLYAGNAGLFPRLAEYSGQDAFFHDLPAGDYAVGSKEFVMHVVRRGWGAHAHSNGDHSHGGGSSPLHVRVDAGMKRSIAWNPDWIAGEVLEGRVDLEKRSGAGLAVLPIYGAGDGSINLDAQSSWRYTSADGTFSTDPMAPRPSAFLFARTEFDSFGYQPVVLDVQPVREDGLYLLESTSFQLRCAPQAMPETSRAASVWLVESPLDAMRAASPGTARNRKLFWRQP